MHGCPLYFPIRAQSLSKWTPSWVVHYLVAKFLPSMGLSPASHITHSTHFFFEQIPWLLGSLRSFVSETYTILHQTKFMFIYLFVWLAGYLLVGVSFCTHHLWGWLNFFCLAWISNPRHSSLSFHLFLWFFCLSRLFSVTPPQLVIIYVCLLIYNFFAYLLFYNNNSLGSRTNFYVSKSQHTAGTSLAFIVFLWNDSSHFFFSEWSLANFHNVKWSCSWFLL